MIDKNKLTKNENDYLEGLIEKEKYFDAIEEAHDHATFLTDDTDDFEKLVGEKTNIIIGDYLYR